MSAPSPILTDAEAAAMVKLTTETLQRKMRRGFRVDELDLRRARFVIVGKHRLWDRASLENLICAKA